MPKNLTRISFDDVLTTQATFNECLRILKPYYKNVKCLAIAQTPLVTHKEIS